jgi:glycosyltransferase involved in cell wall biosynthesis
MTVLMAVYGGDESRLFDEALGSVFSNSLRPDEVVLVVDGKVSPDVDQVIERHVRDHDVRVVRIPTNVGLARALNRGMECIATTWVARADADDVNRSDRFERQAEAIGAATMPTDILGGQLLELDDHGNPEGIRTVPLSHEEILKRLPWRSPFNHQTVVFRRAAVLAAGGYPPIFLKEDYALWAGMVARGARCANVEAILVEATTGTGMHVRRGGLRYAISELQLRRHFRRLGVGGAASSIAYGGTRFLGALLPASLRNRVYRLALRDRLPRPAGWEAP